MLDVLAQTYSYNYSTNSSGSGSGIFTGVFLLIWLAVAVVVIVGMWKVFVKAGKPGWAAIIPIYNTWVLAEIAGKPGWWGLAPLLGIIPFIGGILALIVEVLIIIEVAYAFGKSGAYAVLLLLLPFIGFPMLGFGDAKYVGPKNVTGIGGTAAGNNASQ